MAKIITKDFIDESIKNSANLEGVLTLIVSGFVAGVVASFFSKKEISKKDNRAGGSVNK